MKKTIIKFAIFCIFFIPQLIFTQEIKFPRAVGYVNDFAGVIEENYKININNLIENFEKETTNEIAVVTVESAEPLDPTNYAVKLFEKWGIGKKEKDNGVLILLAMKERKVKIEVGYGLEGVLTDGRCGEILDKYVLPYFKEKKWGEGLYSGCQAIINVIKKGEIPAESTAGTSGKSEGTSSTTSIVIVAGIILAIVLLIFLVVYFSKPKCPKCNLRKFVKVKGKKIIQPATEYSAGIEEVNYYCKKCDYEWIAEETIPQKSDSTRSGGSSSDRSGGGFGGGSSGGGGAERKF